jgi:hypothetical protein
MWSERLSWVASSQSSATLLVENDSSKLAGINRDPWFHLAIYEIPGGQAKFLVAFQFFSHPSKEPFQIAKEFRFPTEVAIFLITYDALSILKKNRSCKFPDEMRRDYDLQLDGLLRDFDKKCRTRA